MIKNIRNSYKFYKKENENVVDINTYININNQYNKFMMNKIFDGHQIVLPCRFGLLSIVGKKQKIEFDENGKPKGVAPDWVKTKELWQKSEVAKNKKQLIYHTNIHTDNVRYKYFWSKQQVMIKNKTLYALRMTRTNKRIVHKLIKEGKQYLTKI
jgi:hypothetical protein